MNIGILRGIFEILGYYFEILHENIDSKIVGYVFFVFCVTFFNITSSEMWFNRLFWNVRIFNATQLYKTHCHAYFLLATNLRRRRGFYGAAIYVAISASAN